MKFWAEKSCIDCDGINYVAPMACIEAWEVRTYVIWEGNWKSAQMFGYGLHDMNYPRCDRLGIPG
jgi:hypothetical protein